MTQLPRSGFYKALLKLFPSDFRAEFGRDMEQLFDDRRREATRTGLAGLWMEAVADVLVQAMREWGGRGRRGVRIMIIESAGLDGWIQDLRFGVRMLLRRPAFSIAAISTLALGIGATVSIFSVVNGVLLKPLPFPESERLVVLWDVHTETGSRGRSVDHPDVRAWQEQVAGLDVAGMSETRPTLTGLGAPEVIIGSRVTHGTITLMGYTPHLGRDLTAADDSPDAPRVVVVSHGFWSDRLGRDPDAIGRTITLGGEPWEVVGVAPADYGYPRNAELWLPRRHELDSCDHGCRIMEAVGRLRPTTPLEEAQANLDVVSARLAAEFPDSHDGTRAVLEPMLDYQVGDVKAGIWVLFGAVGMVLLIACANVANLTLARAGQRRHEAALRASLGATRVRVARQLLTESLLLATVAGVLGLGIATWGTSVLVRMAPDTLPRLGEEAGLDPVVFAFTAALVLIVTGLFGLLPAVHFSRQSLRQRGSSGRGVAGRRHAATSRSLLIAGEVGLSLALLLGAGLLFRTLVEIRSVDYGFVSESSERFRISLPDSRYDSLSVGRFLEELEGRLHAVPGVAAAGTGFGVPLAAGSIRTSVGLLDRPEADQPEQTDISVRPSSPGFLEATGTRLLTGRWFTDQDRYGSEPVGVINESTARRYYSDMDPIGRRIRVDVSWGFGTTPPMTIVGIVEDVRGASATGAPRAAIYLPNAQFGANSVYVWMQLRPGVATAIPEARAAINELDAELAITNVTTMTDVVNAEHDAPRFYLTLLAVFSIVALVLASIGLYGVLAYSVTERRREIGIRIALGAASDEVVRMVLKQGSRPVMAGIVLGLFIALAGSRMFATLLYGVEPHDPLTFVIVTALLVAVAGIATVLPARRASRIPPAQALRAE